MIVAADLPKPVAPATTATATVPTLSPVAENPVSTPTPTVAAPVSAVRVAAEDPAPPPVIVAADLPKPVAPAATATAPTLSPVAENPVSMPTPTVAAPVSAVRVAAADNAPPPVIVAADLPKPVAPAATATAPTSTPVAENPVSAPTPTVAAPVPVGRVAAADNAPPPVIATDVPKPVAPAATAPTSNPVAENPVSAPTVAAPVSAVRVAAADNAPPPVMVAADWTKPVAPMATATLTKATVDQKPLASTRPPANTRSNPGLVKPQDVPSLDRGFTVAMADSDTSPLPVKPAEPLILPTTPQVFRDSAHSSSPVTAISPALPAAAQPFDAVASTPDTPPENISGIAAVTRIADSSVLTTGITATPTAWTSANPSRPEAAIIPTLPLPTSQHLDLKQNHWEQNLGRQLNWMVNNQMQEAEIRVNPPDIGPIEVRMSLQHQQTSVAFFCHDASVREAIEKAMPQLREMLNNQGIYLNQAQVSDQALARQQSGAGEQSGRRDSGLPNPDSNPGADSANNQPRSRQPQGAVDHYV